MKFYMPTTVYQEKDCVYNHRQELAALGHRALIVTGHSSAQRNGSYADVCAALDAEGVTHCLFDEVEENPSLETIMKARDLGVAEGADFVIGIGGGSPMDAAKAIALMIANPKEEKEFMFQNNHPPVLPVAAVPTTCGTGSEVTGISVLTNHAKRTKGSIAPRIYPDLALVDAKYLDAAPVSLICNTATDALAHLVESYIHSTATDYTRMFVREGLRVWTGCKDALLALANSRLDEETANQLMLASTYAGMAIAHTGTSIPHALSYYPTYHLHMPHGKACGYFLPGYLREAGEADRAAVLAMTGFANVDEMEAFLVEICQMEPLPEEARRAAADEVLAIPAKLALPPFPVDQEVVYRIAGCRS